MSGVRKLRIQDVDVGKGELPIYAAAGEVQRGARRGTKLRGPVGKGPPDLVGPTAYSLLICKISNVVFYNVQIFF